jgi:hypothetical protein
MSRGAHVIERVHHEIAFVQVIDHFIPCPHCGKGLADKAARPWSLWCRQCKIQWQQADDDCAPTVGHETRMLMR